MARSVLSVLAAFAAGALLLGGASPTHAQDRGDMLPRVSPNATVSQTVGVTEVRLTYGRPSVDGRTIFGDLVPFGEVWRTGANEATTFSVSTPVRIEGQRLEAGTYGLFTIPGRDSWTIVFNDTADQWGAYNYDSSEDVLRVDVTPASADAQELMTFTFEGVTDTSATAVLHWASTRVPFDLTVNTNEIIRTQANEALSNPDGWRQLARYAGYALEHDVMLDDALRWVNRSIEMSEQFANLSLKARLLAAQDQYAQAVEAGEAALSTAESMDEAPGGLEDFRSQVSDWRSET